VHITASTVLGGSGIRERIGQLSTNEEVLLRKTLKNYYSPGKRQRQRPLTDKNGVMIWPSASTQTWVESNILPVIWKYNTDWSSLLLARCSKGDTLSDGLK